MKIASKNGGLFIWLGVLATAMLFGQQAMAEGTRAGTSIANTATVDYSVGGIDQDDITSDPATATFVVDRRVSFTLTPDATGDLVTVTPGGTDYFVDFTLTNGSNDDLDFTYQSTAHFSSGHSMNIEKPFGEFIIHPAAQLDRITAVGTDHHFQNRNLCWITLVNSGRVNGIR